MRAVLFEPGEEPGVGEHPEPIASEGLALVSVRAAALTNLDALIVGGGHVYSPKGRAVVGREAVVENGAGKRFFLPVTSIPMPHGSMAERTVADMSRALPVPDGVPDALAAAVGNAGLAAWLPLSWRGRLRSGETVLVLGATSTSGRIAVAAAAALGAGRVVAVGRNAPGLERLLSRGADAVVQLDRDADMVGAFEHAASGGVDVVLDYLNGWPAEQVLGAMSVGGRVVQIGSAAAPSMTLPVMPLKVSNLDVLGFAYHHAPVEEQRSAYRELCNAALEGAFDIDVRSFRLGEFDAAWRTHSSGVQLRCVLHP